MKLLFVCSQGLHRSRTAAELFKKEFKTKYAGWYGVPPLSLKELQWADVVMVMEDWQRGEIGQRFPKEYLQKRIISLNIPDVYSYNQPELIRRLEDAIKVLLPIP